MKKFNEYLTESHKTYKFKVKVAGELPESFNQRLNTNMQKFDVVTIGAGKKTPITQRPLDFPNLQNTEVHTFEVEVKYPTTTEVLSEYLSVNCTVPRSHILVRGEFDPIEEMQANASESETYETLLTKEDMGGTSGQDSVAGNRVMDLLKELETSRGEREINPNESAPVGKSKDIDEKQNTKSVMGS